MALKCPLRSPILGTKRDRQSQHLTAQNASNLSKAVQRAATKRVLT
ncbi:hypothetical protein [Nostoc sp.]